MKIVVIGGNGLIGKLVVAKLRGERHEVVAASRSSGVNTLTGEGLAEAMKGATVVVDVANSPSFEEKAAMEFFEVGGKNIIAAEKKTGVKHHVALSVVGTERMLASPYFRAKMKQEELIKGGGVPYTIVRATQFYEFVGAIADFSTEGKTVRLPPAMMQPIVSDDVASGVAEVALGKAQNAIVDLAGPEKIRMDELEKRYLAAKGDARKVVTDPKAQYYGMAVDDRSLMPLGESMTGPTKFGDWLKGAGK